MPNRFCTYEVERDLGERELFKFSVCWHLLSLWSLKNNRFCSVQLIPDSVALNGVETIIVSQGFIFRTLKAPFTVSWTRPKRRGASHCDSQEVPAPGTQAFLRLFPSVAEMRRNWVEGNPLAPEHLSILGITLEDQRPTSALPRPCTLSEGKRRKQTNSLSRLDFRTG